MITIERDDKICRVKLQDGPLGYIFPFEYTCDNKFYAELLTRHFDKILDERIEAVRKEEYDRGYKDGRAKRGKASWFSCLLKTGSY